MSRAPILRSFYEVCVYRGFQFPTLHGRVKDIIVPLEKPTLNLNENHCSELSPLRPEYLGHG
jgi:hypothetical protein